MAQPLDDEGMRTMFVGMFTGMGLYALGILSRSFVPQPYGDIGWMVLTILGLIVLVGWYFAVRRGFRVRWLGRAKSRRKKGRKARGFLRAPPRRP